MPSKAAGSWASRAVEEAPGRRRIGQPAAHEDLGEHVAHPQIALERQRVGGVVGRDLEPRNRICPLSRRAASAASRSGGRAGSGSAPAGGERWASAAA